MALHNGESPSEIFRSLIGNKLKGVVALQAWQCWAIADQLRGAMNADDFRDYMLSLLFLRYLSANYENAVQKELGRDYPKLAEDESGTPLKIWYEKNPRSITRFENQMRKKVHYVVKPDYLWSNIAELARTQDSELLTILEKGCLASIRIPCEWHT